MFVIAFFDFKPAPRHGFQSVLAGFHFLVFCRLALLRGVNAFGKQFFDGFAGFPRFAHADSRVNPDGINTFLAQIAIFQVPELAAIRFDQQERPPLSNSLYGLLSSGFAALILKSVRGILSSISLLSIPPLIPPICLDGKECPETVVDTKSNRYMDF